MTTGIRKIDSANITISNSSILYVEEIYGSGGQILILNSTIGTVSLMGMSISRDLHKLFNFYISRLVLALQCHYRARSIQFLNRKFLLFHLRTENQSHLARLGQSHY